MRIRVIVCALLMAWGGAALAAEGTAGGAIKSEPANTNSGNIASLQRGAKYFVNYCAGCHSAEYVRYNTLAEGLRLTDEQVKKNLMFSGKSMFDTMTTAMTQADGEQWFGKAPPDLTLIARSKGVDYLYNYLRGFYVDPTRPTGSNNLVLHNAAMPDVLWQLQGIREPIYAEGSSPASINPVITGFKVVQEGSMSEREFDQVVRDIVNFLDYIGEPIRAERESLGIKVIGFLLVFLLIAYYLKKEVWKDVE